MPDIVLDTVFGNANLPQVLYPGFYDDFAADDGPLDVTSDGKPWIPLPTTMQFSRDDGAAVIATATNDRALVDALASDGTLTVVLRDPGDVSTGGIVFRATDRDNYYCLFLRASGTPPYRYMWGQVVAGSVAEGAYVGAVTPAEGDVIAIELSGSTQTVTINDTLYVTKTDQTTAQTSTLHGLQNGTVTNDVAWESIEFVPA